MKYKYKGRWTVGHVHFVFTARPRNKSLKVEIEVQNAWNENDWWRSPAFSSTPMSIALGAWGISTWPYRRSINGKQRPPDSELKESIGTYISVSPHPCCPCISLRTLHVDRAPSSTAGRFWCSARIRARTKQSRSHVEFDRKEDASVAYVV